MWFQCSGKVRLSVIVYSMRERERKRKVFNFSKLNNKSQFLYSGFCVVLQAVGERERIGKIVSFEANSSFLRDASKLFPLTLCHKNLFPVIGKGKRNFHLRQQTERDSTFVQSGWKNVTAIYTQLSLSLTP